MNFFEIEFLNPEYFLLLLLLPFILYAIYKKQKSYFLFPFFADLKNTYKKKSFSFIIKSFFITLIFLFYIIIFSNPNLALTNQRTNKTWIDIVLILDISFSMEATDLLPNRLVKAKEVINDFIDYQKTNRVWLVVFAWKPFTSIPLTFDYNILKETIWNLQTDTINQNNKSLAWTAVWDSILMWETLFGIENNREKVIILLTDWDSNTWVDPKLAASNSKEKDIIIYTIWIWSKSWWEIKYISNWFEQIQTIPAINDELLKEVSKITSWEYFRAEDNLSLENIFKYLEKLEKQEIEVEINKIYSNDYKFFVYTLTILIFGFIIYIFNKREL